MSGVSESPDGTTGSRVQGSRSSPIWSIPSSSDALRHSDTPPIGQVHVCVVCEVCGVV